MAPHPRTSRLRILGTPHGLAYGTGGLGLLTLGGLLEAAYLVLLGGALLAAVVVDLLFLRTVTSHAHLQVAPLRVPEEAQAQVGLTLPKLNAAQQAHVQLSKGLHLSPDATNVWWGGSANASKNSKFRLVAKVRGPQSVGPVVIRTWGPWRLWASDWVAEEEKTLEVIPREEVLKHFKLRSITLKPMQGRFQVNRPGQGFEFFTLRNYQPTDTMRDVNWKASARTEDLIVNQRQRETHTELLLLLDSRVAMGAGPLGQTPLDRACRAALALFKDGLRHRDTVRFLAYGDRLMELPPAQTGRVMMLENLLARIPAQGVLSLMDAWQRAKRDLRASGPILVLSSTEADSTFHSAIQEMRARGHPVTVVSPTPTDHDWTKEPSPRRHKAREELLQALRETGASVVDWGSQRLLSADPPQMGSAFA